MRRGREHQKPGLYKRWTGLRLLALAAALMLALYIFPAQAHTRPAIADVPVSFEVINRNESLVPCDADGNTYTVHGSLIGPASLLKQRHRSVSLYIHGGQIAGDHLWRMQPGGDASFDFGLAMARLGHVSVSIELVGYGESVSEHAPEGTLVCQGSQATVIHQVIQQLRSGSYSSSVPGWKRPAFESVALSALSYGVQFSQPATYSFPGDVDALIVMGYAEPPNVTPEAATMLGIGVSGCAPPGQRKYGDHGPTGYHFLFAPPEQVPAAMFHDPEPQVVAEWANLAERDPCGQASSFFNRAATDIQHLGDITVPVLFAFGDHDEVFGSPGPQVAFSRFTSSPDRTLMLFPGAGHVFFLERQRARWIEMVAHWLGAHGF